MMWVEHFDGRDAVVEVKRGGTERVDGDPTVAVR